MSTKPKLRVFLVRHAHAGWALPGVRDFDRPLDDRGREEAERLAASVVVNGFEPDLVICSNARRCTETLDIMLSRMARKPSITYTDRLYSDTHETYVDLIGSDAHGDLGAIMLVGHNPMLEDTAHALMQDDPASLDLALGSGFPTAGLMIIDCQAPGPLAVRGGARFVGLLLPVDA